MARAMKCDRCGELYEHHRMECMGRYINGIHVTHATEDGYQSFIRTFDLCPKCCGELIKWLVDEKEEGKEDGRE